MRTLISAKGETSDAFSIKQAFSWDTFRGAITNTPSSREQVKQERERGRERGGGRDGEKERERERNGNPEPVGEFREYQLLLRTVNFEH